QASPATSRHHPFHVEGSNDHRHLHSFPTRRSSDLAGALSGDGRSRGYPSAARGLRLEASADGLDRTDEALLTQDRLEVPRQQIPDRKSTRLNSSHRTSSYAVFCFKKNIINARPPTI